MLMIINIIHDANTNIHVTIFFLLNKNEMTPLLPLSYMLE